MKKKWQFWSCLNFLFVVLIFSGCEQKPLVLDIGDNGLVLDVVTLSSFNTQTDQEDTLNIGESFKLYVGNIDTHRKSQIVLEINPILLAESNVCNDSTTTLNTFIELRSTNEIYSPIGDDNSEVPIPSLGKSTESDSAQFNAYFISNLDSIIYWNGNKIFIEDSSGVNLDYVEHIPLDISINQFQIKIHLDTLFSSISICDFVEPIYILLKDDNQTRFTEFFSSEFYGTTVGPRVNTEIEFIRNEEYQMDKYSIISVESNLLDETDFYSELDDDNQFSGVFKSHIPDVLIDAPNIVTWEDTAKDIELIRLQLELNEILEDSLGSINLFLHALNFSNLSLNSSADSIDSAGDNWNELDSIGTEGDGIYNVGEYYEDCGNDQICDEDEIGYFPNGTENNNIWDIGEFYLDCGTDSLCDVDEDGYDPILNTDPSGDNYKLDPSNDNWNNDSVIDSFMVVTNTVIIDSVDCLLDYQGMELHTWISESNSNLYILDSWCGSFPNNSCTSCDTLIHFIDVDSTMDYSYNGTENNDKWDFEDSNGNSIFDNNELHEEFIDLGFDNYPENVGNESNDPQENNGKWDFEDLNGDGNWELGEPHENFTDCGTDNLCDINEDGYNPNGKELNAQFDFGEYFEDCGEDQVCGESPDIDDLMLDPNGDNWNYLDSIGTEGNNNYDSLEFYRDWGLDHLHDSLELPIYSAGGNLDYSIGTNTWEFDRGVVLDTIYTRPELGDNDLVVWVSSIEGNESNYTVSISIHSLFNISQFEVGINHIPFFDYVDELIEETVIHTNTSIEQSEGTNFLNDISAYTQSVVEIDSTSFHLNYSDNYLTRIELPQLDSFIAENLNLSVSTAKLYFEIDTSNVNYSVNEAGIKIMFSKFNNPNLSSFDTDKTLISSHVIKNETSLEIDFTNELQRLLTGESTNNGFIMEASRESNNFSHLTFFNELDSLYKPQLEIMIIK